MVPFQNHGDTGRMERLDRQCSECIGSLCGCKHYIVRRRTNTFSFRLHMLTVLNSRRIAFAP